VIKLTIAIFGILLMLAGCSLTGGADTLSVYEGYVLNETGHPVSEASLKIAERDIKVNSKGYFCYEWLFSSGSRMLTANASGYNSVEQLLEGDQLYIDIKLSRSSSNSPSRVETKVLSENMGEGFYCSRK
jgi:hypothetical protein